MKMSLKLKQWLRTNCGVKRTASQEEYEAAMHKALSSGKLSPTRLASLSKSTKTSTSQSPAEELKASMASLSKSISSLSALMGSKATGEDMEYGEEGDMGKNPPKKKPPKKKPPMTGDEAGAEPPKSTEGKRKSQAPEWHKGIKQMMGTVPPVGPSGNPRVKGAWERYDSTKSALRYPNEVKGRPHPMAGRQVLDYSDGGRPVYEPSELDKAVCGAFAKFLCATKQRNGSKTFGLQSLPDHDKELLYFALDRLPWGGASDGGDFADIKSRKLRPSEQKALIDDGVSGGIEAAPIVFDDMVIQTPLLFGELFPRVNQVPLDRGRRIEGVQTGTVTSSWGGVDDSAVTLYNTSSYVSAFDTTIFRWEGAIRVGLDFLSDTPIDFGAYITQQYGERLLEDLDDVIAAGNGSTQPEGIINKAGATSVSFGGATTIGNYESLRFGVKKNEHKGVFGASAIFCGTETSYQRVRAIPVGASDARRLFGATSSVGGTNGLDDYSILNRPYAINESLSNQQIFYAIMLRYRMYRRRGLTLRTSTEGDTLIRNNEMLMVAMARYGGQMERGGATARTTDAPA